MKLSNAARNDIKISEAMEHWLKTDVAKAYDNHKKNPGSAISSEELKKKLKDRFKKYD